MKWSILLLFSAMAFGQTSRPGNIVTTNPSANNTFAGPVIACNIVSVMYVGGGCASTWGGGDIGAQLNAAYLALPANGGRIHIISQASCYSFSTPAIFGTSGKTVLLEGDPGGATCIHFTPSTGAAITIDSGTGEKQGYGIRDLEITGPGSGTSAVGIQLGATNGAEGVVISGVRTATNCCSADGFGIGIQQGAQAFAATIEKSFIVSNGIGFNQSGAQENTRLNFNLFSHNTTSALVMAPNSSNDLYGTGNSFDDNGTPGINVQANNGGVGNHLVLIENHFENSTVMSAAAPYITMGDNSSVVIVGGVMMDDRTTGTNSTGFITCSGTSYLHIFGLARFNGGINVNPVISPANNCRAILEWGNTSGAGTYTNFPSGYTGGPFYQESIDASTGGGQGSIELFNGSQQSNIVMPFGANVTTGLTANLSSTQLGPATTIAGTYMLCISLWPTATGSATAIQAQVSSNAGGGAFTVNVGTVLSTAAATNVGGGCTSFHAASGVTISVLTSGYSGTGTYSVESTVSQLK